MPAARVSDMHTCPMVTGLIPHVGGPIVMGSPNVLIQNMPAARVSDRASCIGPPDSLPHGSSTVLINGFGAVRVGDTTAHGGVVRIGAPSVLIGG